MKHPAAGAKRRLYWTTRFATTFPEWSYQEHPVTIRQLLSTAGCTTSSSLSSSRRPIRVPAIPMRSCWAFSRSSADRTSCPARGAIQQRRIQPARRHRASCQRPAAARFAEANIFRPLGMTSTHVHDGSSRTVRNRVTTYTRDGSGFQPVCAECGGIIGNAGMFSTVRDLLRWEKNAEPHVGDTALVAAMQTPATPSGGAMGGGARAADWRSRRSPYRRPCRGRSRDRHQPDALPG